MSENFDAIRANGNEIELDDVAGQLTGPVSRAERFGEVTYLTRHGRRVAAIVPLERIEREADLSIVLTTVDIISQETGASAEDVRAVVERVKDLTNDESILVSDDGYAISMEKEAARLLYEELGQVIRFTRTSGQGGQDTVTITVRDLEITETSLVNGVTQTRTDAGANIRDVDIYVQERIEALTGEGFIEENPR